MLRKMLSRYTIIERDLRALGLLAIGLFFVLLAASCNLLLKQDYRGASELLVWIVPLLSALIVIKVADRLIQSNAIERTEKRHLEIARICNFLITSVQDMKGRVEFLTNRLFDSHLSSESKQQLMTYIEQRYNSFFKDEFYSVLSPKVLDLVHGISGQIFGLRAVTDIHLAEGRNNSHKDPSSTKSMKTATEDLNDNLECLLDELYELRKTVGK